MGRAVLHHTYKHIVEAFVNSEERDLPDLVEMIEKKLPEIEDDEVDDWLRMGVDINHTTVSEFNIVDGRGIITHSTNPDYIGYDMHSGDQSAEFLCLLSGTPFYSQDVQGMSFDENIKILIKHVIMMMK